MSEVKLVTKLIGMPLNCSPRGISRGVFTERISQARQLVGRDHRTLFAPIVGFTNRVVKAGEDGEDSDIFLDNNGKSMVMVRTREPADGGIEEGAGRAICIFNADCPIIVLYDTTERPFPNEKPIGVLHGGLRTLIRERKDEPNIIEVAAKHFDLENTSAFVGYGIRGCCWVPEYYDKPEVLNPDLSRHSKILASCIGRTTEASPFGPGHVSVDMCTLAKKLLMEVGIPEQRISVDERCTCCAKDESGQPLFWSHNRYQAEKKAGRPAVDGRNLAVAYFV